MLKPFMMCRYLMKKEQLDETVIKKLQLQVSNNEPDISRWQEYLYKLKHPKRQGNHYSGGRVRL